VSLGVVEWDGSLSASELLNEADRRMYRSKHMSRAAAPAAE
jgi:GGDEF domain-containing protein